MDTSDRRINEEKKYEFLLESYKIADQQLEMRIQQRDNFAIQFMVAIGALVSVMAVGNETLSKVCIFTVPIVSFYFCCQILSSYDVHNRLVYYIKNILENELNRVIPDNAYMWESFCQYDRDNCKKSKIGGRKAYFKVINLTAPVVSCIMYFLLYGNYQENWCKYFSFQNIFAFSFFIIMLVLSIHTNNSHGENYEGMMFDLISKCGYLKKDKRISMKYKAIFLDRDGTIHVDKVMTRRREDLEFFNDTISSLKKLSEAGFLLVIITNQSGIGKGIYPISEMTSFNDYLIEKLKDQGIDIAALYYCPHKTEDNCQCKKPKDGMIRRASLELNLDLGNCYLIGDQESDIQAGLSAGLKQNYLVTTGLYPQSGDGKYHCSEALQGKMKICDSLEKAVDGILNSNGDIS